MHPFTVSRVHCVILLLCHPSHVGFVPCSSLPAVASSFFCDIFSFYHLFLSVASVKYYCVILFSFFFVPFFQCISLALYRSTISSSFSCTIHPKCHHLLVPFFHCVNFLHHPSTVSSFPFTIHPLCHSSLVQFFHHFLARFFHCHPFFIPVSTGSPRAHLHVVGMLRFMS